MFKRPIACNEQLKFLLQNAIKRYTQNVTDSHSYARSKVSLFKSVITLHQSAASSSIKPRNLHVISYARFLAVHEMLDYGCDGIADYSVMESIKTGFATMHSQSFLSPQAFQDCFSNNIKAHLNPSSHAEHMELDGRVMALELNEDELAKFVAMSMNTDLMVTDELSKDLVLCSSRTERLLKTLLDNAYVAGWVTTASLSFMACVHLST